MPRRLLLALTAAACSSTACGPQALPRRPLRIALYDAPATLDPHLDSEFLTFAVASNVYEALTRLDADLRVQPSLAERWENPDDARWRFRLRRNVRFHDGRPLTSEDVVASLERARRQPRLGWSSYLAAVTGVRALDPLTVEVTTENLQTLFLTKLAFIMIVPRDAPSEITEPLGTGPYRISWGPRHDRLLLHAFPGYWGRPPSEAEAEISVGRPAHEAVAAPAGERADIVEVLDPAEAGPIEGSPGYRLVSRPGVTTDYLRLRVGSPPFSDRRVRVALHLALDREALVRRLLHGQGRAANQLVGPAVFGHDPSLPPALRDLPRARQLLADAGFPGGLDVEIEFRRGRDVDEIVRQLAEAGIRARPRARPWNELMQRALAGQVALYYGGMMASSGDSSEVLESLLRSSGSLAPDAGTAMGYSNRELDELIETAARQPRMVDRRATLQRCMRLAMEDLPVVPLVLPDDVYAVREGVLWSPRPDGRVLAYDVGRSPPAP